MKIWFSPSSVSFYPDVLKDSYIRAGTFPDDVIEVSEKDFATYSGTPPEGKERGVNEEGLPCWGEIVAPEITEEQLKREARTYRNLFISSTDKMLLADYSIANNPLSNEQRAELLLVRSQYKEWPSQEGWPLIELPDIPRWILVEAVNQGYEVYNWPRIDTIDTKK
jgi:hypothetical protein